jgi:hypothetical protein
MKKLYSVVIAIMLIIIASSIASAGLELSFYLGMRDGSNQSDGVIVRWYVEKNKKSDMIFEQLWKEQKWSDLFVVDLNSWGNETVTLNMTTDPGQARNTGWDWILIAEPKVTSNGNMVYDFAQAVSEGKVKLSMMLDGDKVETEGLGFGANCTQAEAGAVGGVTKPKAYMQHPPWNGRTGNTIARFELQLPASVKRIGNVSATWGQIKIQ